VPYDELVWGENNLLYLPKSDNMYYPGKFVTISWDRFAIDEDGFCNFDQTY
jgi:hypothetical protein